MTVHRSPLSPRTCMIETILYPILPGRCDFGHAQHGAFKGRRWGRTLGWLRGNGRQCYSYERGPVGFPGRPFIDRSARSIPDTGPFPAFARGGVPELVDGHDLGSCAERRGSSSLPFPTKSMSACRRLQLSGNGKAEAGSWAPS
jgi:hypothetical protein